MKIEIIKSCKIGEKTFKKGDQIIVLNNLGKKLIQNKFAVTKDFISLQEIEAAKISRELAEEILEELPTNARRRITEIRKISNKVVLDFLLSDSRTTVRKAASRRIEEIR